MEILLRGYYCCIGGRPAGGPNPPGIPRGAKSLLMPARICSSVK
ncbi:MAG: hypothetical protein QM757_34880 [Paludibaculum sp.]